jgi:cysteinyl-tRNA synthetase
MIQELLGPSIDIHGGGIDLIFPHHENEIAQGEGATGVHYCNYWLHNNFINLNNEKMSKSLGNTLTARAFMDQYGPEVLKFLMLSAHYRSPLSLNEERIWQTLSSLERVYQSLELADLVIEKTAESVPDSSFIEFSQQLRELDEKISQALNDDFNSAEMLAAIFEAVRLFNALSLEKSLSSLTKLQQKRAHAQSFSSWVRKYGIMASLFREKPSEMLQELDTVALSMKDLSRSTIDELIKRRNDARIEKNFALSDEIRAELQKLGIEVLDGNPRRHWQVKK